MNTKQYTIDVMMAMRKVIVDTLGFDRVVIGEVVFDELGGYQFDCYFVRCVWK